MVKHPMKGELMIDRPRKPLRVDDGGGTRTTYEYEGELVSVDYPSTAEEGEEIEVKVTECNVKSTPTGVSVNLFVFLKEVQNGRDQKDYKNKRVSARGQKIEFGNLKTKFPGEDQDYVVELVLQYAPGIKERWHGLDEFFFTVSKPSQFPFPFELPFKLPFG